MTWESMTAEYEQLKELEAQRIKGIVFHDKDDAQKFFKDVYVPPGGFIAADGAIAVPPLPELLFDDEICPEKGVSIVVRDKDAWDGLKVSYIRNRLTLTHKKTAPRA